jgi:N-acyl-D-amino-acid deacylase
VSIHNTPDRCDLLIRGGRVIDGTGTKSFTGDVAVTANYIDAVGDLQNTNAERVIDARGLAVAPGFIDVHTHDDHLLLSNPEVTPKLSQGVTTVVVGNCGVSLAPWMANRPPPPPMDLIGSEQTYCFPSFESYRLALEQHPASINAAPLVGHSTLRCSTMNTLDRPARQEEIKSMRESLRSSLHAGAIGFSTGLAYAPNQAATPDEVAALAAELPEFSGIYATHIRDEGDQLFSALEESFVTARRAGCPVVLSHHKCASPKMWGRSAESLAKIDAASEQQSIGLDVYPYTAGSTILMEEHIERSKRILVTWSATVPEARGKDLAQLATDWDCSLAEAMQRLQPGGGIYFMMEDDDVERILAHPNSMIGSDGLPHDEHPHPRLWGTFPRVLGHYTRERQLFTLEQAVHKMTGLSAKTFHLADRGVLRANAFADIVIFDPILIADQATFEKPEQTAAGIHTVLVNGTIAWQRGTGTGSRTGRILKNPKTT